MARPIRPYYQIIALGMVLLIAAILRLYRISELTEFLGDQGRTGIHIYDAWQTKKLPLLGPTVLTGQHLGPAFYYIIAPSLILTGFNPLAPAIETALIGVAAVGLLWWLGRELFGWEAASMVATLWAVSPQIVSSDRVLWEPNIIPFFVLLFLLSLRKKWGILTGLSLGILVQLHYPNFIFVALAVFYFIVQKQFKESAKTLIGFGIVLLPFLLYEFSHSFENSIGVFQSFSSGGEAPTKSQILLHILDYAGRVIRRVAPIPSGWESIALAFFIFGSVLRVNFWKLFLFSWFSVGITAISLYRGVVFDHYLFFLLPAPFFIFGYLLSWLKEKTHTSISLAVTAIILFSFLSKTDILSPGNNDIERTEIVTNEIIKRAADQAFSFGLIASRSFNDLHYRYFFQTHGVNPDSIFSDSYSTLFLICESKTCPSIDQLMSQNAIKIVCYTDYCGGEYRDILFLDTWRFVSSVDHRDVRLYQYQRQL